MTFSLDNVKSMRFIFLTELTAETIKLIIFKKKKKFVCEINASNSAADIIYLVLDKKKWLKKLNHYLF